MVASPPSSEWQVNVVVSELIRALGPEVEDACEEAFVIYSLFAPSQNLGFIDPKADSVELTVANQDLVIQQSPSMLFSDRAGGTTGAVVWKINPLLAEWLASADNFLSQTSIITSGSTVIELGCGVSGILALTLAPKVHRYIATDQGYVFKLLRQNLENNTPRSRAVPKSKAKAVANSGKAISNIDVLALDWETSSLASLPSLLSSTSSADPHIDVVLACDCTYNENLIEPFIRTCAELCRLPAGTDQASRGQKQTVCVVAQQLRSHSVFEAWLTAFMGLFRVWKVPDEMLLEGLREGQGFVVHVGILKEDGV